jgi:hypothetical protein
MTIGRTGAAAQQEYEDALANQLAALLVAEYRRQQSSVQDLTTNTDARPRGPVVPGVTETRSDPCSTNMSAS